MLEKMKRWRKLKMNLTSSHFSPEGRRLSCERCSAPMFPLILKQTFCFHAVESRKPQRITGQRRYSAAPDTALKRPQHCTRPHHPDPLLMLLLTYKDTMNRYLCCSAPQLPFHKLGAWHRKRATEVKFYYCSTSNSS